MTVLIGQQYGTWLVASQPFLPEGKTRKHVRVICKCGEVSLKEPHKLKQVRAYCSKCFLSRDKKDILAGLVHHWYTSSAKRRNLEWAIDMEQLKELIFQNCSICGTSPKNKASDPSNRGPLPKYNGIDRIDNNLGYIEGNVRTCCRWCNEAKRAKTVEEFDSWIEGIVKTYDANSSGHRSSTRAL